MPLKNKKLISIVNKIRDSDTRWEGLVELKDLNDISESTDLMHYCNDSLWVIRWAVIEKIGDLKDIACLDVVFEKLADKDAHVRKTAKKTIVKCINKDISFVVSRICSQNRYVAQFCHQFLITCILKDIMLVESYMFKENWLISNKLLHLIFVTLKKDSSSTLLKAIKIKNTQKHAIMMLALNNDFNAFAHYIYLYEKSDLKQHIIQAILQMDHKTAFPRLINFVTVKPIQKIVQSIIIDLGQPIVAYLINDIHKDAYVDPLLECLKKSTISVPMFELLEKKVTQYEKLKRSISLSSIKVDI